MADRVEPAAQRAGDAAENIEPAETLGQGKGALVDLVEVEQIERQQRRLTALGPDRVIGFFKPALAAGDQDRMRALARQRLGDGSTDAA